MDATDNDRGQAVVLLLAVVAVASVSVAAVGSFGVRLIDRGRAQTAADAAALAATSSGRSAAQRLAAGNGARLVQYNQVGDTFIVVVDVDGERATATATNGP